MSSASGAAKRAKTSSSSASASGGSAPRFLARRNLCIILALFIGGLLWMFWQFPKDDSRPVLKRAFSEEFDNRKGTTPDKSAISSIVKPIPQESSPAKVETPLHEVVKGNDAGENHPNQVPPKVPEEHQQAEQIPITNKVIQPAAGSSSLGSDTMLLIICSNRPDYLKKTLEAVVKYRPPNLPIFASQDGHDLGTDKLIKGTFLHLQLSSPDVQFIHKQHQQITPDQAQFSHGSPHEGYARLAAHYKWALDQAFSDPNVKRVILLEEDLMIAPDFFELFAATANILDTDTSLLAVSAWNDNGKENLVRDPAQLYRSDFFPGLGWMLPRRVWAELSPKWPRAYWDDWLREPKQRQGRHIIRPEVCRTFHFGARGVSAWELSSHTKLETIRLNENFVSFTTLDLSYLLLPKWDDIYLAQVRASAPISLEDARSGRAMLAAKRAGTTEVRLTYGAFETGANSFNRVAAWSGASNNVKANVPRTAYKGVVTVWKGEIKVHLVPEGFA